MEDLWATLGYNVIASDVATSMQESEDINVLQGPPGVGKSWLARGIGGMWEAGGGRTVTAEGDRLHGDVPLYSLGLAMAGLSAGWRSITPAVTEVARAGETLAGTAGVITATVQALGKTRSSRRRARSMFLGDSEQQILYELGRLSKKRPLLIVADNLHWWDARSLELIDRFREPRMRAAFPFLDQMRLLAVQTPEPHQKVTNPPAHDALLAPGGTRYFEVEKIPRERFDQVLAALGANPAPDAAQTDAAYTLSGGHLALASRCAARMARGDTEFLAAANPDEFVQRLLSERVQSLGELGMDAVALLQVAAVLGLTFQRVEVACAAETSESETSRLLRYCRDEDILELTDAGGTFLHDLYRQHFLGIGSRDRVGIHERLADCLRLLRPGEYELRCLNALDAERPGEAAALAVQAAIQSEREGRSWSEMPAAVTDAAREGKLIEPAEELVSALAHLKHYRFDECLQSLESLPRSLPERLQAEADYLRAMCLMSTRGEADRARGRAILEAWAGYEKVEPEVGMRLKLLLLYGFFHLLDKEPGWKLEGEIRRILNDRVSFDPAAVDALYTLDRCSGGLYQADVALVKNQEAVAHFGSDDKQEVLRRPVEFYRCLVNLGANLIGNARYEEARETCSEVEGLVKRFPDGTFPRVDYPLLNRVLADYRHGTASAAEAVVRQREIVDQTASGDPFYAENALAVYLALAGSSDEAVAILDRLDARLQRSRVEPEPSMVYLIRGNRCAIRFVAGEVEDAQVEWAALKGVVDRRSYTDRTLMLRRHELMQQVMSEGRPMSPSEFDQVLVVRHPEEFGPIWRHNATGFSLPPIEFWREN